MALPVNGEDTSEGEDDTTVSCYEAVHAPEKLQDAGHTVGTFKAYTNSDNDTVVAPALSNVDIVHTIVISQVNNLFAELRFYLTAQPGTIQQSFDQLADLEAYTDSIKSTRHPPLQISLSLTHNMYNIIWCILLVNMFIYIYSSLMLANHSTMYIFTIRKVFTSKTQTNCLNMKSRLNQ